MPAPATAIVSPAISEAAKLAAALITRSLKLLERTVAEQEESSTPPTLKEAAATITTIKRAADTLKILAPLQGAPVSHAVPPSERAHEPSRPASSLPAVSKAAPEAVTTSFPSAPAPEVAALTSAPPAEILSFLDSLHQSLLEQAAPLVRVQRPPAPLGSPSRR